MGFDFVIVGAGSAGCALANRLSEDGRYTVALIEAGPRDTNPWIHIPVGYFRTMGNPKMDWCYETQKDVGIATQIARSPGRVDGSLAAPVRLTAFFTCAAKHKIMMAGRRWAARAGAGAMFFPISYGPKPGKAQIKPGCAENQGRFRFKTQD